MYVVRKKLFQEREAKEKQEEVDVRTHIMSVLGCVLQQLFGATECPQPEKLTLFHTERLPSITIRDYFDRIAKFSECSKEVLVLSLFNINRIISSVPGFEVSPLNIHRLLLSSVLCSAKFMDDAYYNNAFYAKLGGVPVKEINRLEVEFLALINFDLYVDSRGYADFYNQLCNPDYHSKCNCQHWKVRQLANDPMPPHHFKALFPPLPENEDPDMYHPPIAWADEPDSPNSISLSPVRLSARNQEQPISVQVPAPARRISDTSPACAPIAYQTGSPLDASMLAHPLTGSAAIETLAAVDADSRPGQFLAAPRVPRRQLFSSPLSTVEDEEEDDDEDGDDWAWWREPSPLAPVRSISGAARGRSRNRRGGSSGNNARSRTRTRSRSAGASKSKRRGSLFESPAERTREIKKQACKTRPIRGDCAAASVADPAGDAFPGLVVLAPQTPVAAPPPPALPETPVTPRSEQKQLNPCAPTLVPGLVAPVAAPVAASASAPYLVPEAVAYSMAHMNVAVGLHHKLFSAPPAVLSPSASCRVVISSGDVEQDQRTQAQLARQRERQHRFIAASLSPMSRARV